MPRMTTYHSVRRGALVREHDLASLTARLQDRNADLECGHSPATIVRNRPSLCHRLVKLAQLNDPGGSVSAHRHLVLPLVVVDNKAIGGLPNVPALTGDDRDTEPVS